MFRFSRTYLNLLIIICRPDHNLQDIRAKIFPFKRRKISVPEVMPPIPLPVKRKERSLSSLVVSTPRVSMQTGLTGRRTKAIARKSALRGSSFSIVEPIKKEEDSVEDCPESSSSPESRNKVAQTKKQVKEARSFDFWSCITNFKLLSLSHPFKVTIYLP